MKESIQIALFHIRIGWVMQPSVVDDPEHQTLLQWASDRLQQEIRKRFFNVIDYSIFCNLSSDIQKRVLKLCNFYVSNSLIVNYLH